MAPELWPARALRVLASIALATTTLTALAPSAHAIRVATWNVLDYPNVPAVNFQGRQADLRVVMAALDPDVLVLQEFKTSAGRDSFLNNVLNVVQPGQWASGGFISTAESAILYKPSKVIVNNVGSVGTAGPRDVLRARVKPVGYVSNDASFFVYSVHLKAGNPQSSPADSGLRRAECTDIRNHLNSLAAGTHFVVGGDYNFYGSWENGYIRLTESQADNDGRCQDPIVGMTGTWNSGLYVVHHTQSPCSNCPYPEFSAGGMDDRFDLWLPSTTMFDGEGLDLVPGSYVPYGNDGVHYNDDINGGGFNNAVGITVANALHGSSDHLPVLIQVQAPAKIAAASALDFGRLIVGAAVQRTLTVSNPAATPADELSYTLAAPAGFSAPAGPFAANAGAPGNPHAIDISSATAGVKAGTLTVASDDPDSASKAVLLAGTVLDHAVASLDSLVPVTQTSLDFGYQPAGGFTDRAVRVHDLGYGPLRAELAVGAATITGGGGRFSIVGGFTPTSLGDIGRTWNVRFDDTGATPDSSYSATLVFSTADEPIPGAAPAADLLVHLFARVSTGTVGIPDGVPPTELRLLSPRPNPVATGAVIGFDLPRGGAVDLALFDPTGRRVATLLAGEREAGRHSVAWDGRDAGGARLAAGLYFARLVTPAGARTARLVVLP